MFYRIGNLVVRSPLSLRKPKRGEHGLVLRTCRSFPPAHASTKAALGVLQRLEVENNARILDIGCGSGILALAAAMRSNASVLGCDINFAAIRASLQNAVLNRMEDRLQLFQGSVDAIQGKFQLVLANLPASVHTQMFDHYRRLTVPNHGLLIVSGFCDVGVSDIEAELVHKGFRVLDRVLVEAWAAAITAEYTYRWIGLGLKRV